MPKKARKRKPGELVLATFIIPHEKWQDFQKMAKAEGRTASTTLVAFIEAYLAGDRPLEVEFDAELEAELARNVDARIEEAMSVKINPLVERVNDLYHTLRELEKRLGKLENLGHQSKTGKSHPTKFIDVEVIPIHNDIQKNIDIDSNKSDIYQEDTENEIDPRLDNLPGLTQKALCEEFGINPTNIIRNARVRGLSSPDYLQQLTGWVYRKGKYYPPEV